MKKLVSVLLFSMFPMLSMAGDKEAKIRQLMEAQGLISMFENQLEMGRAQSEQAGKQMMDQLLAQMNPSEDFQARFSVAFNNYMNKVNVPWGAEEIVAV
ncbi:hypothetical protein [uncultured Microbulbifer sp.]|uniref:hypothetical protein n=1 Tax=uncultured Microbulbifer sp. TaxID=348147 RepID=UPI002639F848|nr:hypothetical protein [uncultured Microbulbifer sp.]